ncbi:type II secretion system F family protein [Candidatus Woesearchaeota archaeon]|nr:type II secretion system F family protein [Candidatus Woesearchaeota archaeon]
MVNTFHLYVTKFPLIKDKLLKAHMPVKPDDFVKKCFKGSFMLAVTCTLLAFFSLDVLGGSKLHLLWLFPAFWGTFFWFMMHTPDVQIRKRQREIEKEVLFAGRFLLVKIEAGQPFFNALEDASKAKGIAGKYFAEIVNEIKLGTPIEKALDHAVEYSPSEKFRRILWQINNSLKTGTDVGTTLRAILKQIMDEQIIEIKDYGKKLNSLAMFYMLIGVVVPALGMTMFIIVASFLDIQITFTYLLFAAVMLAFLQFLFISLFKTIRPMVQL